MRPRSAGLVQLKPLDCCNGRCQCPVGECSCHHECCGCCVTCACEEDKDKDMHQQPKACCSSEAGSSTCETKAPDLHRSNSASRHRVRGPSTTSMHRSASKSASKSLTIHTPPHHPRPILPKPATGLPLKAKPTSSQQLSNLPIPLLGLPSLPTKPAIPPPPTLVIEPAETAVPDIDWSELSNDADLIAYLNSLAGPSDESVSDGYQVTPDDAIDLPNLNNNDQPFFPTSPEPFYDLLPEAGPSTYEQPSIILPVSNEFPAFRRFQSPHQFRSSLTAPT